MTSKNTVDARKECLDDLSCQMFYDSCGKGETFYFCTDTSHLYTSGCGSILYKKGNANEKQNIFYILEDINTRTAM